MDDLLLQLIDIIKTGKTHKNYKKTVELATLYRQIITNEDTDDLYKKVDKREEEEWFKQRKRLTNLILMPMSNAVLAPLNKVARSNDLRRDIKYSNDANKTKVADLEELLANFYGDKSLDYYSRNRFRRLSDIDPNSWIVIEWQSVFTPQAEYVQPYPFEVRASEAIYFEYQKYILQYLVVLTIDEKTKLRKYTLYGKDQTIVLNQIDPRKDGLLLNETEAIQELNGMLYVCINRKDYYQIFIPPPHNLGYVPAYRTGYHLDTATDELTCVNTFHQSLPYFLDSVKAKSEKDLTFALHTFPIRIQYEQPCPECNHGVSIDGGTCGVCHGKGTLISTSTQETITIPMPKSKDEFIPLESLLTYVRPPSDIIDIMLRNIDTLEVKIWNAVWGTDAVSRQEIGEAVTATEKIITEQAKYDKLYTCAEHICNFWTFAANVIADVTGLNNGLEVLYMSIGKEFSMNSMEELTAQYKVQKDNGMTYDVFQDTEREMVKLKYSNDPEYLKRYDTRSMFRPFADKDKDQINIILSDRTLSTQYDRVLWVNYDTIWDTLELADPNVYQKPIKEIKALLDKEVNRLIADINGTTSQTEKPDMSEPEKDTTEDTDETTEDTDTE